MWTQDTLIYTNQKILSSQKFFHACYPLEVSQYVWLEGRPYTMWCHFTKTTQVWKVRLNKRKGVIRLHSPLHMFFWTHMHEEQYHWVLSLKPGFERRRPLSKISLEEALYLWRLFWLHVSLSKIFPREGKSCALYGTPLSRVLAFLFQFWGPTRGFFLAPHSESSW